MLFYERVVPWRPSLYALQDNLLGSQETLRPELVNGSTTSVSTMSLNGAGLGLNGLADLDKEKKLGPRIVRSATVGRGRSLSTATIKLSDVKPDAKMDLTKSLEVVSQIEEKPKMNGAHHSPPPLDIKLMNGSMNPKKEEDDIATPKVTTNGTSNGIFFSLEKDLSRHSIRPQARSDPHKNHIRPNGTRSTSHSPSPSPSTSPSSRNVLYTHTPTRIKSPKPLRPHLASSNPPVSLGLLA